MSLRVRLFILIGGLLAFLVGAELWLVRTLTSSLDAEVDALAASVGRDVFRLAHQLDGGQVSTWTGTSGPGQKTAFEYHVRTSHGGEKSIPPEVRKLMEEAPEGGRVIVHQEEGSVSRTVLPSGEPGKTRVMMTTVRVTTNGSLPSGLPLPEGTFAKVPAPRFLVFDSPAAAPTFVRIPEGGIGKTVQTFKQRLLLGSLAILGIGLVAAAVVAHRVSAPLSDLARTARAVGEGSIGAQVTRRASGEAGEAIAAFNRMSLRLGELEKQALTMAERQHLGELGEVARGLAHSLRNPLNAIGLSVEELAGRIPSDETEELAASARRQIRHIDQTIRSFLALASGGAGAVERLDVLELVQDVALTALHDARGRVRVGVEGRTSPVQGVAAELKAVLQALVVNAIEASPDGEAVTVRVMPDAGDGGGVRVDVDDAGPGLPPEVRERLFTPHVTTKPSGSGMGLFLAHRIATTRYGGSLELKPLEPRGTRAELKLGGRVEPMGGARA